MARQQCKEVVSVKDTYRRTGRGKWKFEMHYTRRRCSRLAPEGARYCWQHDQAEHEYGDYGGTTA